LGGKVVIQAKRYKNTVGVSAVRDLVGTLQNEGASKGILVTTSGYGKASYDFAAGKPIELFDGTNLMYLLQTHAGINARIEPPDDWQDPEPDSGEPPTYASYDRLQRDEHVALPANPTVVQLDEADTASPAMEPASGNSTKVPSGKSSKVRCHKCQHVQVVPLSQSTFVCDECGTKLTRKRTG